MPREPTVKRAIADYGGDRKKRPYAETLEKLQRALEASGVEFTNGDAPGVRLKRGG